MKTLFLLLACCCLTAHAQKDGVISRRHPPTSRSALYSRPLTDWRSPPPSPPAPPKLVTWTPTFINNTVPELVTNAFFYIAHAERQVDRLDWLNEIVRLKKITEEPYATELTEIQEIKERRLPAYTKILAALQLRLMQLAEAPVVKPRPIPAAVRREYLARAKRTWPDDPKAQTLAVNLQVDLWQRNN